MSSTGRGGERVKNDLYETPARYTKAVLPFLQLSPFTVIEPAAGRGKMLKVLLEAYPTSSFHAIELSYSRVAGLKRRFDSYSDRLTIKGGTFLRERRGLDQLHSPKLIITNPPYKLALEFAKKAISLADFERGDEVAMLLRYGFIASKKRKQFHKENPSDMVVFHQRPSFTGGGSDSCEYAWFIWGMGRGGRYWLV